MNDIITIANLAIPIAGLMIGLFGLVLTFTSSYLDKATRRFFILFFAVLLLYLVSNLVSMSSELYIGNWLVTWTAIFFESFFSSLLLPLLALYMIRRSGHTSRSAVMYIVDILWIAYFALLVYTQTTKNIYYVTEDNVYHRGPLYPVLLIPPALIMIVMLIALFRRRGDLTRKQFKGFLAYIIIPVIAIIAQMFVYGIHFITLGTVVAAGIMMMILLTDQADQAVRQQKQIADQQASLMVLQMRPHFIYNTLMSIYYLIDEDPKRAKSVLMDFSTYLRKNFTAISKEEPVPFSEELEHAKAYLSVAQVRFEDDLKVVYDTPVTDFNVPPLTLQPLVENCVKHGVDPERDPLAVYVRTKKAGDGYDVIVADTGPGFSSDAATSGTQVGLANVRERLNVYGGDLEISSRDGEGSVVTLHIPAGL